MAISDTIQSMYENVGEVYDTITNVTLPSHKNIENIPRTIRDSYLEIMNNGIDVIWDNWEKVVGTGNTLTLNQTEYAPMKFVYNGNTSQEGTPTPTTPQPIHVVSGDNTIKVEGKNLFNFDKFVADNPNGTITGSNSNFNWVYRNRWGYYDIDFKENVQYTISCDWSTTYADGVLRVFYTDGTTQNMFDDYSHTEKSGTINFTSDSSKTIDKIGLISFAGNWNLVNFQIEENSQKTPYQPYQSKTYPIYLGVLGKNLLNKDNIERGKSYTYGTTGSVPTSSDDNKRATISPQKAIRVKPNTKYTFSITNGYGFAIGELESDLKSLGDTGWITSQTTYTITTRETTEFIGFNFRKNNNSAFTDNDWNTFINGTFMFELGESASTYEPYNPLELCKIGDYQDRIFKAIEGDSFYDTLDSATKQTLTSDSWYKYSAIVKAVLTGGESEDWGIFFSTDGVFVNRDYASILSSGTVNCVCNYYTAVTRNQIRNNLDTSDKICATYGTELIIANKSTSSVNDFKTWLSTHNTILYCILATPTTQEITDTTLISQLEAIKTSYEGQTNISQENNNLPFILDVSALSQE